MKFKTQKVIALLAILSIFSCADLEEVAPINSIPSNTAFNNEGSARAALNGVYNQMQDLTFDGWLALAQFFSDEADATGTFPTRLEFGNLNVFPANGTMAGVFTDLYTLINNANNVIVGIADVDDAGFTTEEKADVIAQASFIRAHAYLHLVTLWKEVPLVTQPTVEVGEILNVERASESAVYEQIVRDFTTAANDITAETGPTRASKQAANAFLARIDLYQGNWAGAMSKAVAVLGGDDFDLTAVPFLQDVIYSLGYTSTDGNVLNFFYGPSDFGGRYSIGPSTKLIESFDPADQRFAQTIDTSSAAVPYGVKYPSFDAGISGTATDPILFIRHAEMVMIAAEASAEMGEFTTASKWINQVRTRAGLPDVTLDAGNFVDLILEERFHEFTFEGPFRLIDLRRKGKAEAVLGPLGYDACDKVWPLPQRDVDRNPNLTQNDCCNC